ncbi:MAG: AAA family ATPase [Paludibacteraceae bacterium]|nr:AAA family ATPase [Paludibacteraceae bacterium]
MLRRKFSTFLESFLKEQPNKILLVDGARQIGKSYIIRYVGTRMFKNFVEINLKEDKEGAKVFEHVRTCQDLYMQLALFAKDKLGDKTDTLVFLDEIQSYPQLLTMLKFLNQEGRFRYIASGSQLGIALSETPSVPIGTITVKHMYPLDFEEFLWALNCGEEVIAEMKSCFEKGVSLNPSLHENILKRFRYYLLIGGLPEAVNAFLEDRHVQRVRDVQQTISELYKVDASQYDLERKLKIRRVYDLIPSNLENKRKRVIFKQIEEKPWKKFNDYADEFEYLSASGIALEVKAISNPRFPLKESETKNLLKLYLNDVGLLTQVLYGNNINAVLLDVRSVNLGTVYESVVAQELHAHGFPMYYYDNKKVGEVDFLLDDFNSLSPLPLEVKSGKDYTTHSALNKFLGNSEYGISRAIVFSNEREVIEKNGIMYMPIYYCMFLSNSGEEAGEMFPELGELMW